jgi:UDP-N-acetylglucosamine 4-epimerase
MCKILITGGAGFIGSNLCEYFISKEHQVVCLDNFATGHLHNLKTITNNSNFTLIEGDIRNLETCEDAAKGVDYVLHQAALGSVPRSLKDPIATNDVNVSGFLNMLVASRNANVKRFIYAASSSTYGDSNNLPKVEEIIGKPLSPYAITKYVNELYAEIFSKSYGMATVGLRYFNVFGRKQDPNGAYAAVIPLFIKDALKKKSSIINGDGSQSRDFTYIENVVQANIKALFVTNEAALNQIYNVALGDQTSLLELFKHINKTAGNNINPVFGPERIGDIQQSLADITKAKKYLGYDPKVRILEGLKTTYDFYN